MNREIKFRGKTKSGKWVYGDLIRYKNKQAAIIVNPFSGFGYESSELEKRWLVDNKTVGQYTGQNKDGKEIYEGDILFDGIDKYKVIWLDSGWVLESIEYGDIVRLSASNLEDGFRVIGNIYENPELLSE